MGAYKTRSAYLLNAHPVTSTRDRGLTPQCGTSVQPEDGRGGNCFSAIDGAVFLAHF
jgi:hypothetical protein